MIELTQHIEALLLENDCVIVPGLGGFVAHYTSASRTEDGQLFLPPARMIGFNPQLKMNDGMLVQSYMSVYGTSFSDASKMVEKEVEKLLASLHENGKADLGNIGELRYSIHNTYDFTPYDHKFATPYLYGLDSFEMQELSAPRQASLPKSSFTRQPALPATRTRRLRLHVNRPHLLQAAAMVAIILLFFCLSTPVKNTEVIKANYAQLLPEELLEQIEKQSLAITPVKVAQPEQKRASSRKTPAQKKQVAPVAVKEVKVAPAPATIATPAATAKRAQAVTPAKMQPAEVTQPVQAIPMPAKPVVAKRYHIIIASVGLPEDAETMAKWLLKEGFKEAKAIIGDGKNRIAIGSYATEAEAYQALNEIRQNEAYQNAWVLKK